MSAWNSSGEDALNATWTCESIISAWSSNDEGNLLGFSRKLLQHHNLPLSLST